MTCPYLATSISATPCTQSRSTGNSDKTQERQRLHMSPRGATDHPPTSFFPAPSLNKTLLPFPLPLEVMLLEGLCLSLTSLPSLPPAHPALLVEDTWPVFSPSWVSWSNSHPFSGFSLLPWDSVNTIPFPPGDLYRQTKQLTGIFLQAGKSHN